MWSFWRKKKPPPPPFKSLEEKAETFGQRPGEFKAYLKSLGFDDAAIEAAFSPQAWQELGTASLKRGLENLERLSGKENVIRLREKIALQVVNSPLISCATSEEPLEQGKYPIHVFAGFLFFVNKLVRAFASELFKDAEPTLPRVIEEARGLLDALYANSRLDQAWSVQPGELSPNQQMISAIISSSVRDAAVAHELAHIIRFQAGPGGPLHQELEKKLNSHKRPLLSDLDNRSRTRWMAEFGADLTAVKLLNKPFNPLEPEYLPDTHGLIVLLLIVDLIERRTGYLRGEMSTHPPAALRIEFVSGIYPTLLQHRVVKVCETVCRQILP